MKVLNSAGRVNHRAHPLARLFWLRVRHSVERLQYLLRPGAYSNVFGQVDPADYSSRIDQEFSRASDVGTLRPRAGMKKIVAPNRFRFWIREKRVVITHLLSMAAIDFRWVNADRDEANPAGPELGKLLLETP